MDNCNDEKDTILGVLFASREENICIITKEDKKKIKNLIKDNDKYEKVLEFLNDATDDNLAKDKIKNSLESYIDGMNIVSAMKIKNSMKYGFMDGVRLILECVGKASLK